MDLTVTAVISGEGATLRSLVDIEDAIRKAVEPFATIQGVDYPHHRKGALSVVLSTQKPIEKALGSHRPMKSGGSLTTEKVGDLQQ